MQVLVASPCATSTAVYLDPGTTTGNLGVWSVVPRPTTTQYFPNGQYNITNAARITRGCDGILNSVACTAGNAVNLDGGPLGELFLMLTTAAGCTKLSETSEWHAASIPFWSGGAIYILKSNKVK